VWVTAPTATLAEVWSTALMLLPQEEIAEVIGEKSGVSSVHVECGGEVIRLD
jgi:thiamine biosynthesis lipoprotein ApbE